jgi:phosphoribosylformylglycinamidine cyclo-ligase
MEENNRYSKRGVSSSKKEVHAVVDHMDKGLFQGTFCKVTEDLLTGNPTLCNVIHSDGAGTKSILAYLAYRENGNPKVFHGIAQDSIVMNLDDLACVGVWDRIVLSSTVNRNARNFPGDALASLIEGTENFLQSLRDLGINVESGGGETADVGDLTGTVAVDSCAVAVAKRDAIIDNTNITSGLSIIGFSSAGKASYENNENSGIGSNGLTSARHELLSRHYAENYPETFDPLTEQEYVYCGPHRMNDPLPSSGLTVGEALLSPTRTYLPLIKKISEEIGKELKGAVHCSGGGQTKCLRFGTEVKYVKDNLFSPPPIFTEIQKVSKTSPKEMHQVYNMGHRLEVFCKPELESTLINLAKEFEIEAQVVGRTEPSGDPSGKNQLEINLGDEILKYE